MDDYEELLVEQEEEQLAEALAEEHQAELEVQLEQDYSVKHSRDWRTPQGQPMTSKR